MPHFTRKLATLLVATYGISAIAATPLSDAEFKNGSKLDFPLKDCKKFEGMVRSATSVQAVFIEGRYHVFLSAADTPDGMGAGKFSKKPTQAQLDSWIGKKYCFVP